MQHEIDEDGEDKEKVENCNNENCPLTLISLREIDGPVFIATTSEGYKHGFDAQVLYDYLKSEYNLINPISREPFSQKDLERLDAVLGISDSEQALSTTNIEEYKQKRRRLLQDREEQETIQFLCDEVRLVFSEIMEGFLAQNNWGYTALKLSLYSAFNDLFVVSFFQLMNLNSFMARQSLAEILKDFDMLLQTAFRDPYQELLFELQDVLQSMHNLLFFE